MMIMMIKMIILMILMVMINMNKDLLRTFVQPTAWRKNRDYVLYYHNWSWTVVTGENYYISFQIWFATINQSFCFSKHNWSSGPGLGLLSQVVVMKIQKHYWRLMHIFFKYELWHIDCWHFRHFDTWHKIYIAS